MLTRSKEKALSLSGVSATLRCDHRNRRGEVHPHTWEITAWFSYSGRDGEILRHMLDEILERHQGKCLPDVIAWGEPLAAWIAGQFDSTAERCVKVEVSRAAERLHAVWEAK